MKSLLQTEDGLVLAGPLSISQGKNKILFYNKQKC